MFLRLRHGLDRSLRLHCAERLEHDGPLVEQLVRRDEPSIHVGLPDVLVEEITDTVTDVLVEDPQQVRETDTGEQLRAAHLC